MQFDRNIFTEDKPTLTERILDVVLAVVIGLALTGGLLHWCGALFA